MFIRTHKRAEPSRDIVNFRNLYLGKRCFILGNGPSLTLDDINLLKWEYLFVSNKFYMCFDKIAFLPSFYFVEDLLVFEQHKDEINSLNGIHSFFPLRFKKFLDNSPYKHFFYVPKEDIRFDLLHNPMFPRFSFDCYKEVFWGSTIIYTQIQFAIYMGFKQIYLLGVDHKYSVPKVLHDNKYYISEGERNHFIPNYIKKGEKWYKPQLEILEKSFNNVQRICQNSGIEIYNLSRDTALNSFKRKTLEEVLDVL